MRRPFAGFLALLIGSTALTGPTLAQSLSQGGVPAPTFAIQGSNILLNGNNSLRIDDNDQVRIGTTGLTFAVRVNIPNTVNLNPDEGTEVFPIFSKLGRGSPSPSAGYELSVQNGNVLLQGACAVDCLQPRINGPAVGQGTNVHLAAVFDKTNNTVKLFRDGAQVGSTATLTANIS